MDATELFLGQNKRMLVKKEPHTMPGTEWPLDKTIPSFHKEAPSSSPVPSAKAGAPEPGSCADSEHAHEITPKEKARWQTGTDIHNHHKRI